MRKRTWVRVTQHVAVIALVLAGAGLTYLAAHGFTYYANGKWVQSSLLSVYARSLAGYGRTSIDERGLGPDWGSWPHYAARNFTLDLIGLDYSPPLSWEDIAAGPGLCVMRPAGSERQAVAVYSPGPRVAPGERVTVKLQLESDAWSLILYRPRFSSVAYVTEINETEPSRPATGVGQDGGLSTELLSKSSPLGFALDLFRESFTEDGGSENVLVSPYSVTEAFAMACVGAAGDTRDEMARVLGLEVSNPADIMQARQLTHERLGSLAPGVTLTVANSVWMADRADIAFRSEFVKTCSDVFGAEARRVDFSNPKTVSLINDWVSRNTQGKIPSVVNTIPPEQIAALVNAVYMKAKWQHPFNPAFTEKAQFNLLAGTTAECEMMHGGASGIQYLDGAGFQAIRLPYEGDELGMYLFLPDEDTDLAAFVEGLSPDEWSRLMDEFKATNVRMRLPRFRFEYDLDLIPPLTDLGMGTAFDPARADFSAMCEAPQSVPVYIGVANHKTFISVDEEGTEAAAAIYVAVVGSAAPQNVIEITFDRPFLFAVVDNADPSLILFLGSVMRP